MCYCDEKLRFANGEIDYQYAFNWLMSVKSLYDVNDFLKDMEDIKKLLLAPIFDKWQMKKKATQLNSKYCIFIRILNMRYWNLSHEKLPPSSPEQQLELLYKYLPVFALFKIGVSRVMYKCLEEFLSQSNGKCRA